MKLLSRNEFREQVFDRDKHMCVLCSAPAVDAHHILERRLWPDGGYYLDNGASVCSSCHIKCEETVVSIEDVRLAAGITTKLVPPHLYTDQKYDKWGNCVLPNGTRTKGELFNDSSVLKILLEGGVLHLFTDYVKYPRTYHLPWSKGVTDDDRILTDLSNFHGKKVIVTEKLDGENTTLYKDYIHARSIDSKSHPTRDRVKAIWASIAHDIPEKWRLCGENMYAKHSIQYTELEAYLYIFSIWDEHNHCLSWDDTALYTSLLNLHTVPVLYTGIFCEKTLLDIANSLNKDTTEGYVVRLADRFSYQAFRNSVAKFVRANHVTSDNHWLLGKSITPNKLKT
jgi:hypothetical protein